MARYEMEGPPMISGNLNVSDNADSKKQQYVVHNVNVLDSSGSMSGPKYNNARKGLIDETKALIADTEDNVIHKHTLLEFSSARTMRYHYKLETNTKTILSKLDSLSCIRSMTALNDAIGNVLNYLYDNRGPGEAVLVKIFTDGLENDSKNFSKSDIEELVLAFQKEGFTITFVGTENDVQKAIRSYGIHASNTSVHDNTAEGVATVFTRNRVATQAYSKSIAAGVTLDELSENFYAKKLN